MLSNWRLSASRVNEREDLAKLLTSALEELRVHPERWENVTLEDFLEAWAAWVADMDVWARNTGRSIEPSWQLIAQMVAAASIYE
jgi:hypothetical protein